MTRIVRVEIRRQEGDHVFDLVRIVKNDLDWKKMQEEYPFPLEIVREFTPLSPDDISRLKYRFRSMRVENTEDWFYAYPPLISFMEDVTEYDISRLILPIQVTGRV